MAGSNQGPSDVASGLVGAQLHLSLQEALQDSNVQL